LVNTLIPPTGGSDVARGIQKKQRIMKKEYLSPEIQVVKITLTNMLAQSGETIPGGGGGNGGVPLTKEYNDVSNDNTTTGGSIWDNEW
jgi:hypothetical protein